MIYHQSISVCNDLQLPAITCNHWQRWGLATEGLLCTLIDDTKCNLGHVLHFSFMHAWFEWCFNIREWTISTCRVVIQLDYCELKQKGGRTNPKTCCWRESTWWFEHTMYYILYTVSVCIYFAITLLHFSHFLVVPIFSYEDLEI